MKFCWFCALGITLTVSSCHQGKKQIVSGNYIDSLIQVYRIPSIVVRNDSDILFWKGRILPSQPGFVNESKYAGTLYQRFLFFGDIQDIRKADSILRKVDADYNHHESQAALSLVGYSILQHRFSEADSWLIKAKKLGLKKYDELAVSFDVDFELGRYFQAANELNSIKSATDYGYLFRRSKLDHLNGEMDSSIQAMLRAADLEQNNPWLRGVALANAADLFMHAGEAEHASALYQKCLALNAADFHSLLGLGWIALAHDQNNKLAEKIFCFVKSKNHLPDALLKLNQVAENQEDTVVQKKWALAFAHAAEDSAYGNMYNKYLITLYTGILNNPARAEKLARMELENRKTPQTFSWLAWALFREGKNEQAYDLFRKQVSGLPLEALELYYMGKLMVGMNKGYDAREFFKAATTNKYDLSPSIRRDLEKYSE